MARIYKATIRCHHSNGVLVEPGLHYQTDVAPAGSEPDPDDVASGLWSHIGANFQAATVDDITIDEVVVVEQVLKPIIGVVGVHPVGGPGLMAGGTNALPKELVPIIHFHSAAHSRSARGWSFLGGPLNSGRLAAGGVWDGTMTAALDGLVNALKSSYTLGTALPTHVNPVVFSRTRLQRNQEPVAFAVTDVTYDTHPTWLRSRESAP